MAEAVHLGQRLGAPPHVGTGVAQVVRAWPREWPLAVLWSGGSGARSRWSVVARPGAVRVLRSDAADVAAWLRETWRSTGEADGSGPPFTGGWLGWLSYDLGRRIEPAAEGAGAEDDRGWPLAQMCRIDDALIYDHQTGDWWGAGAWEELVKGIGADAGVQIPDLESRVSDLESQISDLRSEISDLRFEISDLSSHTGREGFLDSVDRVLEYIRAGDVYQVNLAHRLSGGFEGSPRGLFLELMGAARAWYGGYVELAGEGGARAVACASPELFIEFDPRTRRVTTRPMKGTRPGTAAAAELEASEKDRAELNMIVDLMRNDLGRVCGFGSVRVEGREIERHGGGVGSGGDTGILQGVATVSGTLRPGLDVVDVLLATFPGGSITGAPKIRAMQIIDELEPVRRGPYCGCFGWFGDDGAAALNIMIRTATVTGDAAGPAAAPASLIARGTIDYSVGAGIVADSEPEREWEETLEKARVIMAIAGNTNEEPPAAADVRAAFVRARRESTPHAEPGPAPLPAPAVQAITMLGTMGGSLLVIFGVLGVGLSGLALLFVMLGNSSPRPILLTAAYAAAYLVLGVILVVWSRWFRANHGLAGWKVIASMVLPAAIAAVGSAPMAPAGSIVIKAGAGLAIFSLVVGGLSWLLGRKPGAETTAGG